MSSAAAADSTQVGISDVLQERLIEAEYKIWKKNTPYLYDVVMTHALEWPSLTCQWLPVVKNAGPSAQEHSLLLGTHTTGEQNYLMVASCNLPKDDTVEPDTKKQKVAAFDEERKEVGGFGHASNATTIGKLDIRMKIPHQGEVNRARSMPQNHFWVASRGPTSEVFVFDLSKHPSFPTEGSTPSPQFVCEGHTKEGFGLNWSPLREGNLVTASEDKTVRLWDINAKPQSGNKLGAISTFSAHTDVVEDVDWHAKDSNLFVSVGDDSKICWWDLRDATKPTQVVEKAHASDINCVTCNPTNEFVFATGSADKTLATWDFRNLKKAVHSLQGHTDEIYMAQWAPFNESILGSASADRRVGVWDLSRIGMEQTPEDAEDGPPELLFLHGGHTAKLSDFSWNGNAPWTVASVSEDNILQVWQMAEEIYAGEDDDEPEDGDEPLGDDDLE
eukprot:Nitzschia sp. Nitz4//scaffold51_size120721//78418//79910//NITZ4_003737-RA/size120721-snap-gene-0.40-mRNA-1//-1//CDS//3329553892//1195//frame0